MIRPSELWLLDRFGRSGLKDAHDRVGDYASQSAPISLFRVVGRKPEEGLRPDPGSQINTTAGLGSLPVLQRPNGSYGVIGEGHMES
jgi:hypothetical protein